AKRLEGEIADENVVAELLPEPARSDGSGRPLVALRQRQAGVRHPEELEVVVRLDVLVQPLEDLVDALRHLDRMKIERLHAAEGDRRDNIERTEPDTGGTEYFRFLLCGGVYDRGATGNETHSCYGCLVACQGDSRCAGV